MNAHIPTMLAAVSLSLNSSSSSPNRWPTSLDALNVENLTPLRDLLEFATFIPGAEPDLSLDHYQSLLLCLVCVQSFWDDGGGFYRGPPDLVGALSPGQVEDALEVAMQNAPPEAVSILKTYDKVRGVTHA